MGSNSVAADAATSLTPRRGLLADLQIDPTIVEPLGGLNPYSPHFTRIGNQFKRLLIDQAGLTPTSSILDIGCGTGRLAVALNGFLTGQYRGFDVHHRFLHYCRTACPSPNYQFTHVDLRHDEYNPNGTIDPVTFEFPYANRSFDVVTAIAVFNHFHTNWVCQYVRQISRVLKPKGIFLGTILLLNQQSMQFINSRTKPPYHFSYRTPESWHDFEVRPLFNVAHPEAGIRRVFIKSNLMVKEPIRYGEWCGSRVALAGPDIIIARKN